MKHCTLCERLLPLTDFYRKGAGRHSYCKLCHRDRCAELLAIKRERAARRVA